MVADEVVQCWQAILLKPNTPSQARAAAIRNNLPRHSPWRQELLRHDRRLWTLFPVECAELADQAPDSDGRLDTPNSDFLAPSMHHIQRMAADVSVLVSCLGRASLTAVSNADAMDSVVTATTKLQATLQQLNHAAEQHRMEAHRKLEWAHKQRQRVEQLASVVQQATANVETAIACVQKSTTKTTRADVEAAVRSRMLVTTESIESVHTALLDCHEVGIAPSQRSVVKTARALLSRLEQDKDTHEAAQPLVEVLLVAFREPTALTR